MVAGRALNYLGGVMKIRTCKGPRNIRPDGSVARYRAVCGSTNIKVSQPNDLWITYYCRDCHWTNIEPAVAGQIQAEMLELMGAKEHVFGFMGDEAPDDMPDNVIELFKPKEA
jgi:hypothetical protein